MPACHAGDRGFKSLQLRQVFGTVAQLVEQRTENPRVASSILACATRNAEIAQLVEHHLAKVGVASSSLVFRSTF